MNGTYDVTPTGDMIQRIFHARSLSPVKAYGVLVDGKWRKVFCYERRLVIRVGGAPWSGDDYLVIKDVEDGRTEEVAVKDFNALAEVALWRD